MATDSQFASQETSVPLYSVPSKESTSISFNSNQPSSPLDEFSFRNTTPDSTEEYSGSIENAQSNQPSNVESNPHLSNLFSKKRFEWLLEVDDAGEDEDMNKPLL